MTPAQLGDGLRTDSPWIQSVEPDLAEVEVELLAEDAALAVTTALRLYFGNYFGGPYAPARPPR